MICVRVNLNGRREAYGVSSKNKKKNRGHEPTEKDIRNSIKKNVDDAEECTSCDDGRRKAVEKETAEKKHEHHHMKRSEEDSDRKDKNVLDAKSSEVVAKETNDDDSDSAYAEIHEKAEGIPEMLAEDLCEAITEAREKGEKRSKKSKRHPGVITFREIIIALGFGIVLYWALDHARGIFAFFGTIVDILSPIIVGCCIAFVLNLVLIPIEKIWVKLSSRVKNTSVSKYLAKIKRPTCLILSTLIMMGLIFGLLFIVIPELGVTFKIFTDLVPQLIRQLEVWADNLAEFLKQYNLELPDILPDAEKTINFFKTLLTEKGQQMLDVTVNVTSNIFSAMLDVVLSVVFAFYLLAKKERLGKKAKSILYAIADEEKVDNIVKVATLSNSTFTKFVTGQFTEAIIMGFLCWIGMLIFGMPHAAVISVVIGATALIPIFGAFAGAAIGTLLILSVDFMQAVWFVVFIIVLQQIETNLIYPKVVGKSIGLPGILVLASVTVGGAIFGFAGILLGIPVCSVVYCIFSEFVEMRLEDKGEQIAKKAEE